MSDLQPFSSKANSRFMVEDFEPAYMQLYRSGELAGRAEKALQELAHFYQVGSQTRDGSKKYGDIDRRPYSAEMNAAYTAARRSGLWRFDERRHTC